MLVGLQNSFAVSNCAVTTTLAPAAAGLSALLVKAIDSHVSTGDHQSLLQVSMRRAAQRPPGRTRMHCIRRAAPPRSTAPLRQITQAVSVLCTGEFVCTAQSPACCNMLAATGNGSYHNI